MWSFQIIGGGFKMTKALVLINTQLGKEDEALKKVREIAEVQEAYLTYGVYDIIAQIQTNDPQRLAKLVTDRVRKTGTIQSTITLVVAQD